MSRIVEGRHFQKNYPCLWIVFFKVLLFRVVFLMFCAILLFLCTFFWLGSHCSMLLFSSRSESSITCMVNWYRIAVPNYESTQWVPSYLLCFISCYLCLLWLIETCRLCAMCERWVDDSNIYLVMARLIETAMFDDRGRHKYSIT